MIAFFSRHPTAANLLMLLFLALGVVAMPNLLRETFPDFRATELKITVPYPGAAAHDVETAICERVEAALEGVEGVAELVAEARESVGTLTVTMEDGGDFVVFLSDVQSAVDGIDDFPDEAERPSVERLGTFDRVVSIAVTGPMSAPQLQAYCEDVRTRMLRTDGITRVTLDGFGQRQIRIEARAHVLARLGMSLQDLAQVIARQSVDLPAGTVETEGADIVVRLAEERRAIDEFAGLIVRSAPSGAQITLGDVATLRETFDPAETQIFFDGSRAGLLRVEKLGSDDALRTLAAAREFVERERAQAPRGIELRLTEDLSSVVADRLDMLLKNGWQGLLLVFIALAAFFSLRMSFWVAMGLPVSFLASLWVMQLAGLSINMLSMVALLLALGLLMDDAIVIAENVATHMRAGKSSLQAAADGVAEVQTGVLSSFLTTVCVLGPLAFIAGDIGKVLYVVPVVLVIVLAVSLVEAFLILPAHLAHSLRHYDPERPGRIQARIGAGLEWLRERVLGPVVDAAVRWRYLTFGLTIAAFLSSLGLLVGGHLPVQAFPEIEGDVVQCRVLLPQGTPFSETQALVTRVVQALEDVGDELSSGEADGQDLVRAVSVVYGQNSDAGESGPHVATVSADLLSAETRTARVDALLSRWRARVGQQPGVIDLKFTEPASGPAGRALEMRFQGDDLSELDAVARGAQAWFARFEGVFDLSTDLRPGKPELAVELRGGSLALGLDGQALGGQLRAAFSGLTVGTVQTPAGEVDVDVRLAASDRDSTDDVYTLPVRLPSGALTPLDAVARVTQERGFARIVRRDGRRSVTLVGDVDTSVANTAELVRLFRREFLPRTASEYPDVEIVVAGESAEGAKTQMSMVTGMATGLLGVFLLLSFQFRSYLEPLVVMVAIPFALIGVIGGHLLLGHPLTMPSILGFVSLSGVVVNDSILLVEFIKLRRRAGHAVEEAARAASRERFRAVLLTSLTTIIGLLPLLAERSPQAQVIIPLAVSIVFGIAASTVLVLVVVPCLYTILGDLNLVESLD